MIIICTCFGLFLLLICFVFWTTPSSAQALLALCSVAPSSGGPNAVTGIAPGFSVCKASAFSKCLWGSLQPLLLPLKWLLGSVTSALSSLRCSQGTLSVVPTSSPANSRRTFLSFPARPVSSRSGLPPSQPTVNPQGFHSCAVSLTTVFRDLS